MSYECLLYEVADGVATITLNRPESLNAFSPTQISELADVWRRLRFDDAVRVAIITGAGERAFTTGIDLTFGYDQPVSPVTHDDPMVPIGPKSCELWKPVIAAVNGMACGGAFYILGQVEMIVAAEHATFFDPHLTHGMPAIYEPMYMLQRMPLGEIMRLTLLGRHERMSAQRAHEIGLVQEVVPAAELLDAARWAARIIADSPNQAAVEATVKAVWTAQHAALPQALLSAPTFTNSAFVGGFPADEVNARRSTKIEPRIR